MPQVIASPIDVAADAGERRENSTGSREFRLVLACCAAHQDEAERGEIDRLLRGPVEWNAFLETATFHNVEPLVARQLLTFRESLPSQVAEELDERFRTNVQRGLRLTQELLRILECLDGRKMRAVPFKGPVLAEAVYGDVGLRQFSDLDVLIPPNDYAAAAEAVKELGYRPSSVLRPAVERAWIRSGYERSFDGPLGKNLLELQWRLLPRFYVVDADVSEWRARATTVTLGGREVPTLATEDLLLALCVHASKHAWMRLGWVCDIAWTVQSQSIEYDVVRERAEALGVVRIVAASLWLANRLLGAPVPGEFARDVESVAVTGERVRAIVAAGREYPAETFEYFRLMTHLRERRRDRVRFLWRLAVTPGVGEWEAVRLPGFLFPLYRVVRLGRLMGRAFGKG